MSVTCAPQHSHPEYASREHPRGSSQVEYAPIDHSHDYAASDDTHDYAGSDHHHFHAAFDHTHKNTGQFVKWADDEDTEKWKLFWEETAV